MKLIKRNDAYFPSRWEDIFDRNWLNLPGSPQAGISLPAVNLKETENGFDIELAVPGLKKEDFKIDLDHNLLTISAEDKSETSDKDPDGKYTRREFNYRSFKRAFTLPETSDSDNIQASYQEGVLSVHIPKKEEAKPKPAKLIEVA